MRAGTRLRSTACDTEVVVVRAAGDSPVPHCGGFEMTSQEEPRPPGRTPAPGLDGGTLLGKRYADASVEVLCTKGGAGTLSLAGEVLELRSARQLPASD
jgi:hypothetical protein